MLLEPISLSDHFIRPGRGYTTIGITHVYLSREEYDERKKKGLPTDLLEVAVYLSRITGHKRESYAGKEMLIYTGDFLGYHEVTIGDVEPFRYNHSDKVLSGLEVWDYYAYPRSKSTLEEAWIDAQNIAFKHNYPDPKGLLYAFIEYKNLYLDKVHWLNINYSQVLKFVKYHNKVYERRINNKQLL